MGFRTTLITEDIGLYIPDSFLLKYPYCISKKDSSGKNRLALGILQEIKFYNDLSDSDIFKDIQNLMVEQGYNNELSIVLLHECGGITKVQITKQEIRGFEPTDWKEVTHVEHDYCYGCSDIKKLEH